MTAGSEGVVPVTQGDREAAINRLRLIAEHPENWRHIYNLAVSPNPMQSIAWDLRAALADQRDERGGERVFRYPDGVPGTPEYEPGGGSICARCGKHWPTAPAGHVHQCECGGLVTPTNTRGGEPSLHNHPEYLRGIADGCSEAKRAVFWAFDAEPDGTPLVAFVLAKAEELRTALATPTDTRGGESALREAAQPFANAASRIDHYDGERYDAPLYAMRSGDALRELLNGKDGDALTVGMLRDLRAAFASSAAPGGVLPSEWQPMDSAPKDGTIIELVVDYTDGSGPLMDAILACTIGWNGFDDHGVDEWHFAGWDWCQDYVCAGSGTPVAWRPSRLNACDDALGALPPRPALLAARPPLSGDRT